MANDSVKKSTLARWLFVLLILILLTRLVTLSLYPLYGTTEPRYAEIARKMLETKDWITPRFDYGVPFWGKPPLLFWSSATTMAIFGVNEFGARFAPFCASLLTLSLFWFWPSNRLNSSRCRIFALTPLATSVIYLSTPAGFLATGFVATDIFLTLGLTLSMVSFWQSIQTTDKLARFWRWGFFLGISIGLLAKGPLSMVLLGIALALWISISPKERLALAWARLPWLSGIGLTAILVLPWYLLAEHKTPGFLNYFIVGEHFERFLVKGWTGDRYGAGHAESLGMIWWFAFETFLPWSLVFIALHLPIKKLRMNEIFHMPFSSEVQYLCAWILAPLLFFSLSRNILEAYALPALPAFAILMGKALLALTDKNPRWRWSFVLNLMMPITAIAIALFFQSALDTQSQKHLLQNWKPNSNLIYLEDLPLSAVFYSSGKAKLVRTLDALDDDHVTAVMPSFTYEKIPQAQLANWHLIEKYAGYVMLQK